MEDNLFTDDEHKLLMEIIETPGLGMSIDKKDVCKYKTLIEKGIVYIDSRQKAYSVKLYIPIPQGL